MLLRSLAVRAMRIIPRNDILLTGRRHFVRCILPGGHNLISTNNNNIFSVNYQPSRCKWKKKGPQQKQDEDSGSESDTDDNDQTISKLGSTNLNKDQDPGTKLISYRMDSSRIDKLVRKALNLSVKQFEELFYDKKISVNDEVLRKKSQLVEEGDIITVPLQDTAGSIALGALIEVLEVREEGNGFAVKIARNKSTHVSV